MQLAAESVTAILQSKRPDDDISAELVELLGTEDMELIVELTRNRSQLVEYLVVRLSFSGYIFSPACSDTDNRAKNRFEPQSGQVSNAIFWKTSIRKPPVGEWRMH